MERISQYISYQEGTRSQTATAKGIDNTPDTETLKRMQLVGERVHTPLREHFNVPIPVSSFYRSARINRAVGGSDTSQHVLGEAMDLDVGHGIQGVTNADLFYWIRDNLTFDQLIWEFGTEKDPDWVHVSYTQQRQNRGQVLRAIKTRGRTIYQNFR